jgi:DNA repair protein RadA/Sms
MLNMQERQLNGIVVLANFLGAFVTKIESYTDEMDKPSIACESAHCQCGKSPRARRTGRPCSPRPTSSAARKGSALTSCLFLILSAGPALGFLGFSVNILPAERTILSRPGPLPKLSFKENFLLFSHMHQRLWRTKLREKDDDDDEEDDDDDDDIPEVDTSKFKPPTNMVSYGLNRGRSSPAQRKAMGTSGSSSTTVYVCTNCGAETVKWMGRCPTCKEWNTLQEFRVQRERQSASSRVGRPIFSASPSRPSSSWVDFGTGDDEGTMFSNNNNQFFNQPIRITDVFRGGKGSSNLKSQRIPIPDDEELSTVLGGGIMKGSLSLVGGTPGVGKSTLLLQVAASVASMSSLSALDNSGPVWYVSGEETAEQIASRAERLQLKERELWLLSETHVDSLAEQVATLVEAAAMNQSQALYKTKPPSLLIVDSIQTMVTDSGGASAAGGVTQMRECVALFLRLAKSTGIPIILVGHVTKSGDVAGPRTIEHMVDCVLYLEGVGTGDIMNLRMLRASKNRFGSTDEVGVYEMTAGRLLPVSDPSSLLLSHRLNVEDTEGCAITVAVEGLRAMTVEIQALVAPTAGDSPKRTINGITFSRLMLLLGVLQKRCGMYFGKQDVYVNVVGNIRLDHRGEGGSSSDLAVAMTLVSSLTGIPVRSDSAFVGEIGLLGELRSVAAIEKRIQEARRMGFSRVVSPVMRNRNKEGQTVKNGRPIISRDQGIEWVQCETLLAAINAGLVREFPKRRKRQRASQDVPSAPGSLNDIGLEETIMDNEHDEDGESVYL